MKRFFINIINLGVADDLVESLAKRIRLTNFFALVFGLIAMLYGILFWTLNFRLMAVLTIPFGLGFHSALVANYFHRHRLSRILVTTAAIAIVYTYSASFGPSADIHYWFIVAVIVPYLLFDMKEKKLLIFLSSITLLAFLFLKVTNFSFSVLPVVATSPEYTYIISIAMVSLSLLVDILIVYLMSYDYQNVLETLLTEKERQKTILESTPAIFYSCNADGDYGATYMGANIAKLGYLPEEFTNDFSFWTNHIHPDDVDTVFKGLDRLMSAGKNQYEYRFRKKDGTYLWVRDTQTLIKGSNQKAREFFGFLTDITTEKEAMWQVLSLQKALTDSAIVSITNANGQIIYANEQECKTSGYSSEELMGQDHRLLKSDLHSKEFYSDLWQTVKNGKLWRGEICNKH